MSEKPKERITILIKECWDGKPIRKKKELDELGIKESTFDSTVKSWFKDEFDHFKKNAKSLECPKVAYLREKAHCY